MTAYCLYGGAAPIAVDEPQGRGFELFAASEGAPVYGSREPDRPDHLAATVRIIQAHSCELFDLALRVWMSEEPLTGLLLGLAAAVAAGGEERAHDYADPRVRALHSAARRVDREIHRLVGLARFLPLADGIFAAPLEPDHNILAALLPRFIPRFNGRGFALLDLRRGFALARLHGVTEELGWSEAQALISPRSEDEDAALWRRYFSAAGNPARKNPRPQRRLMPSRYWKYLPELAVPIPRPAEAPPRPRPSASSPIGGTADRLER
jgi:probable DNA metabolism protein